MRYVGPMKVAKYIDAVGAERVARVEDGQLLPLRLPSDVRCLADLLAADNPIEAVSKILTDEPVPIEDRVRWLPPIDRQEVWAAGVTYLRSQTARMEESEAAASCYDRVYRADRPELFFKATPGRVRGHQAPLRIRRDSEWNVPEPEITLVLSPALRIVGLTCGNDMSSRDIEGENPLYLPQAKCYAESAGLGPWITLIDRLPSPDQIGVSMKIERAGEVVFTEETSAEQMARGFEDLVGWLGRDNEFPQGAFLMTGTGIVPASDFTLRPGDAVHITVDGVGTLTNTIVQR